MNSLQKSSPAVISPASGLKPQYDQRRGHTAGMNPDLLVFSVFNAAGELIGITSGVKQRALPAPNPIPVNQLQPTHQP